jgi:hypothetical protein
VARAADTTQLCIFLPPLYPLLRCVIGPPPSPHSIKARWLEEFLGVCWEGVHCMISFLPQQHMVVSVGVSGSMCATRNARRNCHVPRHDDDLSSFLMYLLGTSMRW